MAARIRRREETELDSYAEAVALIVAMEMAQLACSRKCSASTIRRPGFGYGYSLGEIAALVAGGVLEMKHAFKIPLSVAKDCVELARDSTLGVLFCAARRSTPTPCKALPADQPSRAGGDRHLGVSLAELAVAQRAREHDRSFSGPDERMAAAAAAPAEERLSLAAAAHAHHLATSHSQSLGGDDAHLPGGFKLPCRRCSRWSPAKRATTTAIAARYLPSGSTIRSDLGRSI